ncbi:MAG: GH32 C-terminal domain-containing protein, partial [Spirochaetales bacterium]
TETFYMQVEGTGNCEIKLMNTSEEILIITLTESEFIIDRSKAGLKDFNKNFNSEKFLVQHTKRPILSKIDMCIIFDVSVAEVFACDGFIAACTTVYPQSPYDAYEVTGDVQVKFCEI